MSKTDKVEGIVIRRRNSGEADKIVTLFTRQKGKLQVKAPNVRKIASRRAAHLELINHCQFSLYKGKSMQIVTEAVTIVNHTHLKTDLSKIAYAYHLCELIDGLTAEGQEHAGIFQLFSQTLSDLEITDTPGILVHQFEIQLLTYLGFWSEKKFERAEDVHMLIENLLERGLRSKKVIPLFK